MCNKKEKSERKPDKEADMKKNLNNEEYIETIFNKIVSEWRRASGYE